MPSSTAARTLEGRKQVRLRLRPNLAFVAQPTSAGMCTILQDPVSLRYFRLEAKQKFVVDRLDGAQTLDEIRQAYDAQFRPERVTLEELESFAAQLLDGGLAQNESPQAGPLLYERAEKQRRQQRTNRLLNLLSYRIPLVHPDRLLARLLPWVGGLFTPAFALAGAGLMLAALALVATHWHDFLQRLPAARDLLNVQSLVTLWVALGLVKIVHELGHGLSCKKFGGHVAEMGVLLLFCFPSLYCDVTDGWRIPEKRRRLAVSAAGIYVELLVAALATFGWWWSDPASVVSQLCLALMVVCSVSTVALNANPLMRYDGYYLLSDWLEIPNLSEQASRVVRTACRDALAGTTTADPTHSPNRRLFLGGYAVASALYRAAALTGCCLAVVAYLQPHKLGSVGVTLGVASFALMLGMPVVRFVKSIQRQGRLPEMKPARVLLLTGALAAVALIVGFVPLPHRIRGTALVQIEPDETQRIVVPQAGGIVGELFVRDGQRVRAGAVLAVLVNRDLETKLRLNEADQALRLQQKSAYHAELTDAAGGPALVASLQQTDAEWTALVREHAALEEQRERLTLRATNSGIVTCLGTADVKGKWLEPGALLCQVANDSALRAVLLVRAADRDLVVPGSRAVVQPHGSLHGSPGVVAEVAHAESQDVPPQLVARVGGDVATLPEGSASNETPREPHYRVSVRLARTDGTLHPGSLGRARIDTAPQTIGWHVRRAVASTFNFGL